MTDRQYQACHFYGLLSALENKLGGMRILARCDGRMSWPKRGVYFFFENGEARSDTGTGPRIVRVGTHALKTGSKTSLWDRLRQHRGNVRTPGGNHRGSVFRKHTGSALLQQNPTLDFPSWAQGGTAASSIRNMEQPLEALVSKKIGEMPFLWLDISDPAGPESLRGYVERNAITILSNYNKEPVDPPSESWLGHHCPSKRIPKSGLWNSNHVDDHCDDAFLEKFEELVAGEGTK